MNSLTPRVLAWLVVLYIEALVVTPQRYVGNQPEVKTDRQHLTRPAPRPYNVGTQPLIRSSRAVEEEEQKEPDTKLDTSQLIRPAFPYTRPEPQLDEVGTQPLIRSARAAQQEQHDHPAVSTLPAHLPEDTFDIKAPQTDDVQTQPAGRTSRDIKSPEPRSKGTPIRPIALNPGPGGVRPKRSAQEFGNTDGYHPIQTLPGHIGNPADRPQIQPIPGHHNGGGGLYPIRPLPGQNNNGGGLYPIRPLPGQNNNGGPLYPTRPSPGHNNGGTAGLHPISPYSSR